MKIAIIGYSGAGKSTMAKRLGEIYSCPVMYLDTVGFTANWQPRELEEAVAMAQDFLNQDSWVVEGNWTKFCYQQRLEDADKIIFFNFSRWVCLWGAIRRYIKYRGKTRESIGADCKEKLDWAFVKWILRNGRTSRQKQRYRNDAAQYPEKFVELNNRKQANIFLQSIEASTSK